MWVGEAAAACLGQVRWPGTRRHPVVRRSRPARRTSRMGRAAPGTRCGQPMPRAMGSAMSGGEAWAMVEPSMNSTIECTIDCGCTTASMRSSGTSKSRCASMTSSALVDHGRRVGGDDLAHVPGGVGQRLGRGDIAQCLAAPAAEGAAGRCHDELVAPPPGCRSAVPGRARSARSPPGPAGPGPPVALTSWPPTISDSLLASASRCARRSAPRASAPGRWIR